ncbi:putative metallocarboxypeptidase ecm14, partial [Arthroderma sp. PD_2]
MHVSIQLGLILSLASSLSLVSAIPQHDDQAYTFHSTGRSATANTDPVLDIQQGTHRTSSTWTRLRDSLVESVWGAPRRGKDCEIDTRKQPQTVSKAPATLQARYGEDVVLRFMIRTEEEVKALIE